MSFDIAGLCCSRFAFQVIYEAAGEVVAQFKATVLIMPNGLLKIAGLPLDMSLIETDAKLKVSFP